MYDKLFETIDDRRDELVALTAELIRFPTINPPGDAYRPCAEYHRRRGWGSAASASNLSAPKARPATPTAIPRINVVARFDGRSPRRLTCTSTRISTWSRPAKAGPSILSPASSGRPGLRPRRLRHEGRAWPPRSSPPKPSWTSIPDFPGAIEISGTVDEESGGFGGVAYLAGKLGYFSKPKVDHVIIPEPLNKDRICLGHRGVWWAEIETKGEIAHGSMPFLGDSAVRHMGAVLEAFEDELFPALDRKMTRMPVVPEGARRSTMNINSIHGGQTEDFRPGLPSPNVPDSCRLTIDRRFLLEEDLADGEERGDRHPRPAEARAARSSTTRSAT